MRFSVTLLTALAALAAATPHPLPVLEARDAPNPNDVHINSTVASGSGCPVGTVTYSYNPDRKAVILTFDDYQVGKNQYKFCNINMALAYPKGWTFSISKTTFKGSVKLDKTCKAELRANYHFTGSNDETKTLVNFTGPKDRTDYSELTSAPQLWQSCKNNPPPNLNIKSSAAVDCQGADSGQLTVDTADLKSTIIYNVDWERCG